ncbi:hypothetical protein ACFLY3_02210 [Chloroflexota bacterium]
MEKRKLNTSKFLGLLVQLENDTDDYLSIYASPPSVPNFIFQAVVQSGSQAEDLKETIASDTLLREAEQRTTGVVIFWSQSGYKIIIIPPFPLAEDKLFLWQTSDLAIVTTDTARARFRYSASDLGFVWVRSF